MSVYNTPRSLLFRPPAGVFLEAKYKKAYGEAY